MSGDGRSGIVERIAPTGQLSPVISPLRKRTMTHLAQIFIKIAEIYPANAATEPLQLQRMVEIVLIAPEIFRYTSCRLWSSLNVTGSIRKKV
jgi:hypothetical protein|tara:strand:+ start:1421 stop:1696 length:276 start_codon:yes stop_codon:yes gene_type:complete